MSDYNLTQEQMDEIDELRMPYFKKLEELQIPAIDILVTRMEEHSDGRIESSNLMFVSGRKVTIDDEEVMEVTPTISLMREIITDNDFASFMMNAAAHYEDMLMNQALEGCDDATKH